MELASVLLARAMAFVEPTELNPESAISYRDLVGAIVNRYSFQKFPQKIEEFDESKGVVFAHGQIGGREISQFIIYTYGLLIDTRSSTDEAKDILLDALSWASRELSLTYKPSMVKRWQYASQLTFYSKVSLTSISPAFQRLAKAVEKTFNESTGESLGYEVTAFTVDHDQLLRKHAFGRFSIQRRENTPFSDNKYYSDAPLPTKLHIEVLEQFERDVSHS